MTRLLHHLFVSPLGRLPYPLLYLLADALGIALWWSGYRKKVVLANLERVFPEENAAWHVKTARNFYTHLAEVLVESLRHFHAGEAELLKRYHHVNPEVLDPFVNRPPGVLLSCGHYGNWERYAVTAGAALPLPVMGVYKPLSNAFYDALILKTRGKLGTELVPMKAVSKWMMDESGRSKAATLAVDQRPLDPQKAWWMEWMGQETAMHFGLEAFARKMDMPVVFFRVQRASGKPRGHWEVHYDLITDAPNDWPKGALLRATYDRLEAQIREEPAHWLWSHTRWKHSRPEGVPLQNPAVPQAANSPTS
jgi:KDO2-lipid IV(A) lauroyltransferase